MAKYIFKRLVVGTLSLFIPITITFFPMHVILGDPLSLSERKNVPEKIPEQIPEKCGFSDSLPAQYVRYLGNLLHGDMGTSFKKQDTTVNEPIADGFPVPAEVGVLGIAVAPVAGIPLGVVAAVKRGKLADGASMVLVTIGVLVSSSVFCVLMMHVFCEKWKIFPSYGLTSWKRYVLPMFRMVFSQVACITRLIRFSTLEAMRQDYTRTECSEGVPEWEVIDKHALKNSVLPVVIYVGPLVAVLFTGMFIIEKLFSTPGLGRYFIFAIMDRDYFAALGPTVFLGVITTGCNLIVDIMYAVIDPRVKITEQVKRMEERVEFTMSDVIPEELLAGLSDTEREMESINRPSISYWRGCWIRLKKDKLAILGTAIVVIMTLTAIFVPMFSPYTYGQTDFGNVLQWSNSARSFGTDKVGRDIFVRTTYGACISLLIGLVAAVTNMVIGVLYSGISGYVGGTASIIMMRVVDTLTGIPNLIYMILIMMFLGNTIQSILIAMCLTYWITTAKMVRAQILTLREQDLTLVAKVSGLSRWQILIHHLIPNSMGSIIVTVTPLIPSAILQEASLSFLSIGTQVPKTSWGTLANDAIEYLFSYPHQMPSPALAISITISALSSIGDGPWDALDPRLKK